MNLNLDRKLQGLPSDLGLPLTASELALWVGLSSQEVSALRRKEGVLVVYSKQAYSQQHQEVGLELYGIMLDQELLDAELAAMLGWTLKKLRYALLGQTQLELLDLIKIKKLGADIYI